MNDDILASVDLGSNSFRLLIAKIRDDGTLFPIDQIKETLRLVSRIDEFGVLDDDALKDILDVLSRFGERLVGFKQNQVRAVATSAFRMIRNSDTFIGRANQALGFNIEIISGNEEARLIYLGAAHSLAYVEEKRLVIDIGGGSTEFVIGNGFEPKLMESVTMGCVTFSDKFFPRGVLSKLNFSNAICATRSKIQAMEYLFGKRDWVSVIATSGSANILYNMCTLNRFAEQITLEGLYRLKSLFIKSKSCKTLNVVGLKEDRKHIIAGGLAIMIGILEELDIEGLTIADGALREGVLYDLIGRKSNHDLRYVSVNSLKERYEIDKEQSLRVSKVAVQLYKALYTYNKIDEEILKLLEWAAELYEIGLSISHNDYHKHGAYILANADIAGFSKPEQTVLADLVRAHRGNLVKAIHSLKSRRKIKDNFIYKVLSFRLAVIFCRNRKNIGTNSPFKIINIKNGNIDLFLNEQWINHNPLTLYSLKEEVEQWGKFGINIVLY